MAEPAAGEAGPVRVVVADDQTVVRDGVCLMLGLAAGIEVVGTAGDGAEAVAVVTATEPDVLLVDLQDARGGRGGGDPAGPGPGAARRRWSC